MSRGEIYTVYRGTAPLLQSARDFTEVCGWVYSLWTPPFSSPPWLVCILPVIQASNWSRPGSIILLAGSHTASDWPLNPGHCFWSYLTGFKKRWKLSITRWWIRGKAGINTQERPTFFSFPCNQASSCAWLVFQIQFSSAWSDNLYVVLNNL